MLACLLSCALGACNVYDASRIGSAPEPSQDSPPMSSAADAAGTGGAGGSESATQGGRTAPEPPTLPALDAALPIADEDAGTPDSPLPTRDRKRLTIDESLVDEDLIDFPLWVRLQDDPDLMSARADGRSLFFTDASGQVLDAEIEAHDLAAGELTAWVRVPRVSSTTDTVVYLYWDDGLDHTAEQSATGVWRASFEAVFHLSDSRDASPHARHGEDLGSEHEAGQLGAARGFDGSSYIAVGQRALLPSSSYTITAWIRPDLTRCTEYCAVVTNSRTASPFEGLSLYVAGHFVPEETGSLGTFEESMPITESWHFSEAHVVSSERWSFVAMTVQIGATEGSAAISLDGQPWTEVYRPSDGNTLGFQSAADGYLDIGRFEGADGIFHAYAGDIDELRIAATARSAAWIRAEHENQRGESTFLSVASERH